VQNNYIEIIELVSLGQVEAVKKLISVGCDLNKQDESGNCAVLMAACRNDLSILKVLFDAGADMNMQDSFGNTVLSWAKKHQNNEMIQLIEKVHTLKS
jgi:ankyrin repeat protein